MIGGVVASIAYQTATTNLSKKLSTTGHFTGVSSMPVVDVQFCLDTQCVTDTPDVPIKPTSSTDMSDLLCEDVLRLIQDSEQDESTPLDMHPTTHPHLLTFIDAWQTKPNLFAARISHQQARNLCHHIAS